MQELGTLARARDDAMTLTRAMPDGWALRVRLAEMRRDEPYPAGQGQVSNEQQQHGARQLHARPPQVSVNATVAPRVWPFQPSGLPRRSASLPPRPVKDQFGRSRWRARKC